VLHPDLINANMKAAQYAVRGELYLKGEELRKSGREILYTNGEEFGREKKEREKEREDIIFSFPRVDKDLEKRSPRDPVNTFRFVSFPFLSSPSPPSLTSPRATRAALSLLSPAPPFKNTTPPPPPQSATPTRWVASRSPSRARSWPCSPPRS